MILALIFLIVKFFDDVNAATVAIQECHNGGAEADQPPQGQIPRRPVPSPFACRDNDQNGLCNALFPNDNIANNLDQ